jgi:hypothetical protein
MGRPHQKTRRPADLPLPGGFAGLVFRSPPDGCRFDEGLDLGGVFALGLDLSVPSLDLEHAACTLGQRATLAHRDVLLAVLTLAALLALALDHPSIFVTANDKRLLRHAYLLLAP